MENLPVTVIIPTYNRKDILRRCLNAFAHQSYPAEKYEIIVIDDGSTDGTEDLVKSFLNNYICPLRYLKQENKGPAAARNLGIKNATGDVILFTGDDIIVQLNFLKEHMAWHDRYPDDSTAVLGHVTWSPDVEITPFMRWLENGGPQFHFWQIKDRIEVESSKYFYTCNVSLKKRFLLSMNLFFDEDFPHAACEDAELGMRLEVKGLVLKYNKNAIGYHDHYASLRDYCRRMIIAGKSLRILDKKKRIDRRIVYFCKLPFYFVISKFCYPLALYYEKKMIRPGIFKSVLRYYTCMGYLRDLRTTMAGAEPRNGLVA